MIVLDTSIVSAAFRRRPKNTPVAIVLKRLVREDVPLSLPGIVLQEVLSGIRTDDQFERLRSLLGGFPLLEADREDHVRAAMVSNACRRAGVAATTIDCLIAAQTIGVEGSLFTLDRDFRVMAPHCGLKLFPETGQTGRLGR